MAAITTRAGGLTPGPAGTQSSRGPLLDVLSRNQEILETYRLWSSVKARVMFETRSLRREQVPEYAPIQNAGHAGGEFFFAPSRA